MGKEPRANMSCSTTSGNPCNNLASMVGYNPREKMVALLQYDTADPSNWNNGFDGTIKKAITTQRVHMPLNFLNDQVEAGVQFKLRADPDNAKLCPDIDVSVELPCAPSGVEAAIFCENALSVGTEDHIIGFDIEKVMSGKYPMSLRCQGDKVEVSVVTPLGINFVLSKSLTAKTADGWHFRLEGCKSLGNSHFIKNRCLMHCAADYKSSVDDSSDDYKSSGNLGGDHGDHTLKLECDVGFKVFDQLTLWNTNDFYPSLNGSIEGWKTAVQVETQDLLSCNNLVDMLRSASSKSSEDTTTPDH